MGNLENILAITTAIRSQKANRINSSIDANLLQKEQNSLDTKIKSTKEDEKNFLPEPDKKLLEKNVTGYNPLKLFSEYISALKNKLYGYYSDIKKKFKITANENGYTDKYVKEFEDWGVIYYKPAFKKLVRMTPMGMMDRYQQKLWLFVGKTMKS